MTALVQNYLAIDALCLVILCFTALLVHRNAKILYNRKKFFMAALVITATVVLSELMTVIADAYSGRATMCTCNTAANVIGFSLTPLIGLAMALVLDTEGNERWMFLLLIPSGINLVLTLLSPGLGLIFSVSPDNVYQRGPLFPLFALAYVESIVVFLWQTYRQVRYKKTHIRGELLSLVLLMFSGTLVQIFWPQIHISWLCVTVALTLYCHIISELDEQLDSLTKLYNRKTYDQLVHQLHRKNEYAVIMLDVNQFKSVNDQNGHRFGDQCLSALARFVEESFGDHGDCFRYGGDEFCVVSHDSSEEDIVNRQERLMALVKKQQKKDANFPLLACGCAFHHAGEPRDFEQVLDEADEAMYRCKNAQKAVGFAAGKRN